MANRWQTLINGFTGGNPEIQADLNKMYADQAIWQTEWKPPYSEEAQKFICKALKHRK